MEEEEEAVKVLSISELLQCSRPLTGASSLISGYPISPNLSAEPPPSISPTYESPNPNPSPRFLKSVNHPTVLIGTLTLDRRCSRSNCLSFSDGSSTVCCDVLELDLRIIEEKIHVLAWHFIPFKCGGGFLEIIRWILPPCSSNLGDFRPVLGLSSDCKNMSQSGLHGLIESVSPVSVVPCTMAANSSRENSGMNSSNVRGFLARIIACKCKAVSSKNLAIEEENQNSHSFTEPVFVYFSGSASYWYPVISKLLRNVVLLSGLRKKMVFIGREESELMYVTTDKTMLYHIKFPRGLLPCKEILVKGKGECGDYTGTVTGIHMQGMVVELDQGVWLLLTDQVLNPPHSLRVGAIVSVRNVHFVNPKFSWTRVLILGACFRTSITMDCFSPMETRCYLYSQSQSHLGKFIDSLAFSARLWVLLVVSCFKKKFAGILSEKEILGSKNKEGMIQRYATSHLPSSVFRSRHGLFLEYCKHDSCGCGNEPYIGYLKLVAPISSFLGHCEATWNKMLLECDSGFDLVRRSIRRILQSDDIGVVLLGSLKVSPSSGRLQLIDATGSIDIVMLNISTWDTNGIYEVNDFTLVMEGKLEHLNHLGSHLKEAFSCRSIFKCVPLVRERNLTIYIHFHSGDLRSRNRLFHPCIEWKEKFRELESGRYKLLYIAHKFPLLQKFEGEQVISNKSSVFAEAIILPWDLFIASKAGDTQPTDVSIKQLKESVECSDGLNYQERSCKRYKIDPSPGGCSAYGKSCGLQNYHDLNSAVQFPCLISIGVVCDHSSASPGILHGTKSFTNVGAGRESRGRRIFLEFMSESFCHYQLVQIGGYYIMKNYEEDMLGGHKDSYNISGSKLLITSRTHLWSLSFYSDEFLPNTKSARHGSLDDLLVSNYEVMPEFPNQTELPTLKFNEDCCETSDICLYLSADAMSFLEVDVKVLREGLVKRSLSVSLPCSGSSDSHQFMPEGSLVSLRGYVAAVIALQSNQEIPNDFDQPTFVYGVTSSACINVLVDNCIVKIFGALSKHAYLIGFGPGANAIFYRLLVMGGQNEFMLTPMSFIVINSVKIIKDHDSDKYFNPPVPLGSHGAATLDNVPSGLISEIIQSLENKPMQFRCRVVAVYILVLEKYRKVGSQSGIHSTFSGVNIPIAGFVLEDGSASCCCWVNNERAATLLRLIEEFPHSLSGRSFGKSKKIGTGLTCKSGNDHVEKILEKHGRVVVKNYGSVFDSSRQDLTVSVDSDNVLSNSDENLLKFVILNGCFGSFWTLAGTVMDSNAIGNLERCCMEMGMTIPPIPNIWATEVYYTDPLTEARKTARELLDSRIQ